MSAATYYRALAHAMRLSLVLALVLSSGCGKQDKSKELRVAAASSLAGAFESLSKEFKKESGIELSLVLSSSGNLTQQIKEGAPYDLFASADQDYLSQLEESKAIDKEDRQVFAKGRLVMWVKSGEAPKQIEELKDARFEHISIASPEHAPYGMAAKAALAKTGVWDTVEGRVVRGSNVRQAMQYVESGNAEVGLIALSLALHGGGAYTLVDEAHHKPLEQGIAIVSSSSKKEHARAFIQFLTSDKGAALLKPYGLQAAQ